MNDPNREVLRNMINELTDKDRVLSPQKVASYAFAYRDCRLELIRSGEVFTENQLHRLQQLQYRLDMVVEGNGIAESIWGEARRALEALNR